MPDVSYARSIPTIREPDILVAGGGIAGICAAVSAAQQGANVLLIEQFADLGGMGVIGGVCGFCGHTRGVGKPFDDIVAKLEEIGAIADYDSEQDQRGYELPYAGYVMMDYVLSQGVEVLLHTRVVDAIRDSDTVSSVIVHTSGGLGAIVPKVVIDCTGDADIAFDAGFPTDSGSDDDSSERLPMSLYFSMWDTSEKQTPWLPDGCPVFEDDESIPMTTIHGRQGGRVDVKMKVIQHSAVDGFELSDAEIDARRLMMGLIYYLQTKGYRGRTYETFRLSSVSPHIGVREGRRIIGEHRLTIDEVKKSARFDDYVAIGTYHVDYHWPNVLQRAGTGVTDAVPAYQIPLRALIPRGASNLLVAGRCASGDQMAMSSFRVMATGGAMGCAAGTCAAMCAADGTAVLNADTDEIRRRLKMGGANLDTEWHHVYQRSLRDGERKEL
jgi:hypothetical protein